MRREPLMASEAQTRVYGSQEIKKSTGPEKMNGPVLFCFRWTRFAYGYGSRL